MNILGTIRKASAVVSSCGWLATIITALGAAMAPAEEHVGGTLAVEILFGSVAATATLVYVVAALTTHIDDTQWSIGYAERIVQQSLADGLNTARVTTHENVIPLRSPTQRKPAKGRSRTGT
jgi:hypothetical protein